MNSPYRQAAPREQVIKKTEWKRSSYYFLSASFFAVSALIELAMGFRLLFGGQVVCCAINLVMARIFMSVEK